MNEEVLAVDTDHNTLCNLDVQAEYFQRICSFIDVSLQDARFAIIKGSPTCRWKFSLPLQLTHNLTPFS